MSVHIEIVTLYRCIAIRKQQSERNKLIRDIDRTGNKRDYAILMTLLMTGSSVSGLVTLDLSDVDVSDRKGSMLVRSGKGNKESTLADVEVRSAIEKYLDERTDSNPALFISNRQERISI
ncbi:tyrosine-type recombinase/integrase [Paenibacillus nitricinens]|uniref:tyrosine-type recombinase/integrase n=1 Tax=Paenibacillus nitricinens TaxID=3367691 RepID=UPI003F82DE1E